MVLQQASLAFIACDLEALKAHTLALVDRLHVKKS